MLKGRRADPISPCADVEGEDIVPYDLFSSADTSTHILPYAMLGQVPYWHVDVVVR